MGKMDAAIVCLEGLLKLGYDDFDQLSSDKDLDPIRGTQFDEVVKKYNTWASKVTKVFDKKGSGTNKPWLLW